MRDGVAKAIEFRSDLTEAVESEERDSEALAFLVEGQFMLILGGIWYPRVHSFVHKNR